MADRDCVKKTYLTESEAKQLSRWAAEVEKSESALLREAVLEYLDHDRAARIEETVREIDSKIDDILAQIDADTSHTHTPETGMNRGSDTVERARQIIRRIQNNHGETIQADAVDRAIEDIAGADDRTLRKYKGLFRKRGLLFEHPGTTAVWTSDSDQWLAWMKEYTRLNGIDAAQDIGADYPVTITERMDGGVKIMLSEGDQ